MAANQFPVFEHEKIKVGQHIEDAVFEPAHFQSLAKYLERENTPYFKLGHNSVTFTEFVGVIKVGNLTIEVLPKADKPTGKEDSAEKGIWQNVLINMLRKVNGFDIQITSDASLRLKPNAILHFYFELFVKEVELLLHQGLVKRYRKEEGNSTALKGSLQFAQHIQKNLTHQERFFVRYTTYDRINPYNQVLYKTLCVLQKINTSPALQSRIGSLLLNFPEMPDLKVDEAFFEKLALNRKTEGYRKAIQISRLILLNYHPDLSDGRNDVLALMFDMNDLWEKYVLVCLRKAGAEQKVTVKGQSIRGFWKPMVGCRKTIRPDIVLEKNDQVIVVDTKWKRPQRGKPDDGDLKQMYVYNLHWKAKKSYLLYPGEGEIHSGSYFHFETGAEGHKDCSQLWKTVLGKEDKLDPEFGRELLKCLGLI